MNRRWDWHLGAALLAAPLFGGLFLLLLPVSPADPFWPWRQPGRFIGLVLLWPVMEEVIFRGGLQSSLVATTWGSKAWRGITLANAITSLVFATAHLFSHPPLWAFLVFFPSLLFGFFRDRYNSLAPPLILHITYNLTYYGLLG